MGTLYRFRAGFIFPQPSCSSGVTGFPSEIAGFIFPRRSFSLQTTEVMFPPLNYMADASGYSADSYLSNCFVLLYGRIPLF